jgi:tetratricopeptide (TPR) repeat protein
MDAARKLEQYYPNDLSTLLFMGSFYILASEPDLARASWEKVVKLDPGNETALLYLAAYHSSDNSPVKAVAYWNEYIQKEPNSSQAYYQLGIAEEKLDHRDKAEEYYKKAVALRPEIPEAYMSAGQLYEKEEKYEEAGQAYTKYLETSPDNISALIYIGGYYYRHKDADASEKAFLQAFKLNPADLTASFWLGVIAESKKNWNNAIKYFEIIASGNNTPAVMIRLSYYYSAIGDHESALKCLKKVVEMEPENPVSYYMLGLGYSDMKKFSEAEKNFKKAKSLSSSLEGVSFHLGMLFDQAGHPEKALKEMEAELKINPDYGPALNYIGYTYADKGLKLDEAEAMIAKAIAKEPGNGSYLDSMGWVYYKKGDLPKAEEYLLKAAAAYTDAVIFEHLGGVYLKQDKNSEAWSAYRHALDLDAGNKNAKTKLAEVEKLLPPDVIQRKYLKRASDNIKRLNSLKTGFVVSGSLGGNNFRFAGVFQYLKPGLWRADVLGSLLAPQIAIIQNNGIFISPEALGAEFPKDKTEIFSKVEEFFNAGLIDEFDSDKTQLERKGGKYYYILGDKRIIIDPKNSALTEYSLQGKVLVKFNKYSIEDGLSIPTDIDLYSENDKLSSNVKFMNCVINKPLADDTFKSAPQSLH